MGGMLLDHEKNIYSVRQSSDVLGQHWIIQEGTVAAAVTLPMAQRLLVVLLLLVVLHREE